MGIPPGLPVGRPYIDAPRRHIGIFDGDIAAGYQRAEPLFERDDSGHIWARHTEGRYRTMTAWDFDWCAAAIEDFRRRQLVPGVALCLFTDNGPQYAVGRGQISVEQPGGEVSPNTLFCACSLAKCVTAALLCQLAASGDVDLDAAIGELLPGLRLRGHVDTATVTLNHLLSNTGGFVPDRVSHDGCGRNPADLVPETLATVARMPFIARPGEIYGYSNAGIALAGCAAEVVTGVRFAELVRERILRPLGMRDTVYDPARAMTFPLMQEHRTSPAGDVEVIHQPRSGARHQPTGLCFTTVTDLARFGASHLRAARDPSGGWLRVSHESRVDVGVDIDLRYGLGMFVGRRAAERWLGHEGFYQGIWCKLLIVPGKRFGLVWADNRGPEVRRARYDVIDQILASVGVGRPDPRPTAGVLRTGDVAGSYRRFGAAPVTVLPMADADDLEVRGGRRTIRAARVARDMWAAAPEEFEQPPWLPHADTRSIAIGFRTCPRSGAITHLRLNGLPYARSA
jgi:CubicO group peptidase (beta-lactamase class C family)